MKPRLFRISALLIAGCSFFSSCSTDEENSRNGERIGLVVSILPQVEFAERVGGDRVEVSIMIPPGASPHTYEPAPARLAEVGRARLYLAVGSGLPFERAWLEKLGDLNPKMRIVDLARGIDRIGRDPHIWLSPRLAGKMVVNLCRALSQADPVHQAEYERNRDAYLRELEALDLRIRRIVKETGLRSFMVYHPSWGYFAREYGLEQLAVEAEGKDPAPQRLARLVDLARRERVQAIFVSPQFDRRSAQVIADEVGARIVVVDPLPRHYLDELNRFAEHLARIRRSP